jgi:signal transduction histidine kinase
MSTKPNQIKEVILRRSSLIIGFILILGAFGLLRIVLTHKDIDDVANIDLPLIEILTTIETNQLEQAIHFERALRFASEMGTSPVKRQDFMAADSMFRYLAEFVDLDLLEADHQVSEALKRTNQETQRIKLKGLLLSVKKLEADHTSYENHALEVIRLLEAGELEEAIVKSDRVEAEEDQFNKQVEGVLMRHEMFTEALVKIVEQEEVLSMKWIVTLTLIFVILSLLAVYSFSYRIWRPLEDIRMGAEKLGEGDLDTRLKLRSTNIASDIVETFNSMADQLQKSQLKIDQFIHFSYSTANDLKAPIANMKSLLEMLDRDKMKASNYDAVLRNAKKSANQLEKTIFALSEVNKVREELKSEKEEVNFDETLKEVVGKLLEQIKGAKATIKKDFSDCENINFSRIQLKTILYHLLTNSIKYRDPEKPLIVKFKTIKKNGKISLITKDNGLGFDSIKHQDEIVKPFVRLHSHTEGTGLGLYIIKIILDYNKGTIKMESEPKQGATFALRLS